MTKVAFVLALAFPVALALYLRERAPQGNPGSIGDLLGMLLKYFAPAALLNLVGACCGVAALLGAERSGQRWLALLALACNLFPYAFALGMGRVR